MIDSVSFGKMRVKGETYTKDLIVFPDKVISPWWRKSGHRLCLEDLHEVFEKNPDVLIIGTGSLGRMKVTEDVKQKCRNLGINCIIEKTNAASKHYNEHHPREKTIGAFHLTC
jgi:hypothetical protein